MIARPISQRQRAMSAMVLSQYSDIQCIRFKLTKQGTVLLTFTLDIYNIYKQDADNAKKMKRGLAETQIILGKR